MCGIFGSFNVSGVDEKICSVLHLRGPDGSGYYKDPAFPVSLGHNRLSIIDLSTTGKQPMCNEDGTIWITFNGEIYNYQELRLELKKQGHIFKSETDTEVVIHAYEAWGKKCLCRFNGMFAFCIWDRKEKQFFMARDRLGIKPLYYTDIVGQFIFGSEPKVILAHPGFKREMADSALISYLVYRYIAGEQSIWKGIKRLLPGYSLTYDLKSNRTELEQYWSLTVQPKKWNEEDALLRLEELLESSVEYRLIADVPVGIFLSGGIDSSAIVAMASKLSPQTSTFSIGFSGSPRSELSDALTVANYFNTDHHQDEVGGRNFDELKNIFSYMDEPLGDSSIIPTYLVCRNGRKYAKVILSGDGGDELMGGYNWYTQFQKMTMLKSLSPFIAPILRLLGDTGKTAACANNDFELYRHLTSPRFLLTEIKALFPWIKNENLPESENYLLKYHYQNNLEPHKRWQYVDAMTFMTDDILTKVDRSSMANSLEVRVPFLDHRLVEFAFSLPDNLCIRQREKKYLLKRFMKHRVPKDIINKPKQGFSCPVTSYWPIEKMIHDINKGSLLKNGIMDRFAWNRLCSQRNLPFRDAKIWLIAVLDLWSECWLN